MFGIKLSARVLFLLPAVLFICAAGASAQGPAGGRIEAPRDSVREIEAKHSLDVARWYLVKRKAYEGARDRLQEILDTYPEFSKIDEVFFLLGEAHLKLGKPERASEFYNKLVEEYPGSQHVKKARERLEETKSAGKGEQKAAGSKREST